MAKLEKIEFITIPDVRVIGCEVALSLKPGTENPVPALWEKILFDGTVDKLKELPLAVPDCTIGWMGDVSGDDFKYIAGVIAASGTPVPEGMQYRDISACTVAKGYIHGNLQNGDVYCHAYDLTAGGIVANHFRPDDTSDWSGEIYPDELNFYETEGTICYFVPYRK